MQRDLQRTHSQTSSRPVWEMKQKGGLLCLHVRSFGGLSKLQTQDYWRNMTSRALDILVIEQLSHSQHFNLASNRSLCHLDLYLYSWWASQLEIHKSHQICYIADFKPLADLKSRETSLSQNANNSSSWDRDLTKCVQNASRCLQGWSITT